MNGLALRTAAGEVVDLPVDRWFGEPTPEEEGVLDRALAPVLDVGCGPGRHVLALARRGMTSLGIDSSPEAVAAARRRGAPVLERSVFCRLPGAGRWGSALLLDGNIGIGGDPAALLSRLGALVRPGGRVLVELEAPGFPTGVGAARLEDGGEAGPWFPWARVGVADADRLGRSGGCPLVELWEERARWFARFDAP
ncbi:MAG: class I SAM-dependent methyltransferase [Acidimicrobiia bacterium]